ncbi:alpha/beta-hydrolase [Lichtheimia hyalospora FSU 10163]|nr:alpha/beta-hydrolase [Lichtheimia hyalospora FSU 10163]
MLRSLCCQARRHYSSATSSVPLSFTKYPAPQPTSNSPLLVCHGLFGSKQNWRSLGKSMSTRLSRDVYTLDLRNHGESPHADEHTYHSMAGDLVSFISDHNLEKPILLGHSMGGKTVMATSLLYPSLVEKLVVVDIAPFALPLSNDFGTYVDAMREIDHAGFKKQSDADALLAKYEKDIGVRQFLLTNLKKRPEDGVYKFRVPYETLGGALGNMGDFSKEFSSSKYSGPTLFIAGGKSSYGKPIEQRLDQVKTMFPDSRLEVVQGAGHWVHAEKPEPFMKLVVDFIGTD